MSSLYEASVLEKISPTVIDLNIRVVHPDAMHIPATPGFVLMLLQESADEGSPILNEIDFTTASDATWLQKYATGFVSKVETRSSKNVPPKGWYFDDDHEYWKRDEWLSSVIRITVTHEAWIEHLWEGQGWHGASYEPNSTYDDCEPILPETQINIATQKEPEDHSGFLPIPSFFYLDMFGHLPSPVWIPKYGAAAYIVDKTFKGDAITPDLINSLIGKPVIFTIWGARDIGVVSSEDYISTVANLSWGQTGFANDGLKIGIARFNPAKKRLNPSVKYSEMMLYVAPLIESVSLKGTKATFTIICPDPKKELSIASTSDALALMAMMEFESWEGFENAPSKLGQFLHRKMTELDISDIDEALCKYAGGFITSFSISRTKTGETTDFDTMETEELLKTIERKPWTKWVATIDVTDSAWIEHLDSKTPFSFGFDWMEEAQPWTGAPIIWTPLTVS